MPTYAILGATGQTGGSILQILLQNAEQSNTTIHCFARSRSKLLSQKPELDSHSSVKIFTGSSTDPASLVPCLKGTDAVFACAAVNANAPGTSIALDTAHALIASLTEIHDDDPEARLPAIVVLSSASVNEHLSRAMPSFVHGLILRAAGHIYADLRKAEAYYRAHDELAKVVFVQPGGLVHDSPKRHVLSTENAETPLSFLDLAAGMIEIAEKVSEDGTYAWEGVAVNPAQKGTKFPLLVPVYLLMGLACWYVPVTYQIFQWVGLA